MPSGRNDVSFIHSFFDYTYIDYSSIIDSFTIHLFNIYPSFIHLALRWNAGRKSFHESSQGRLERNTVGEDIKASGETGMRL